MNGIKKLRRHLEDHPNDQSSTVLARLIVALEKNELFRLGDLYELDYNTFSLAIEIMEDWRLDRYYASRTKVLDYVLHGLPFEGIGDWHG